jgi:long-chain acyl-CoA synthetase
MSEITPKPWLKSYPAGVNAEINTDDFSSLAQMLDYTFKRFGDKPAFSNMGHALSFADVDRLSAQLAAYFQSELGLKKGDRIVIQMPNLLQYPVSLFAALRAGLVVINMNPLYTAEEMEHYLRDSGALAIVVLENFADKLEKAIGSSTIQHVIITDVGDLFPTVSRVITNVAVKYFKRLVPHYTLKNTVSFREALEKGEQLAFTAPDIQQTDVAFLQYTGGTTGVSKAAMLTHRNLLANQAQMLEWMKPKIKEGEEVVITALPLYHAFCLTVNCFGLFRYGGHNILITDPRDMKGFIDLLGKVKPTVMTTVSTLLGELMNQTAFANLDLSTMKVTVAGGMALKGSVAEEWLARTKTPVVEGYGLTEASPVVSCNPLDGHDQIGTIGLPLPSTEMRVVDDNNNTLAIGESGELCVKGPQVMLGYWNQPEETKHVFDSDGWLHTGDIAVINPDGFIKIMDRKKDMILVSGFKVFPNEVEDVAMHNPKVLEAAAIGVPDEHSGEAVKLFVTKRDPSLTEIELKSYFREHLTGYKRPRQIVFVDSLPKNNVGKVVRRELKEMKLQVADSK